METGGYGRTVVPTPPGFFELAAWHQRALALRERRLDAEALRHPLTRAARAARCIVGSAEMADARRRAEQDRIKAAMRWALTEHADTLRELAKR
jgi:hypothetical protein